MAGLRQAICFLTDSYSDDKNFFVKSIRVCLCVVCACVHLCGVCEFLWCVCVHRVCGGEGCALGSHPCGQRKALVQTQIHYGPQELGDHRRPPTKEWKTIRSHPPCPNSLTCSPSSLLLQSSLHPATHSPERGWREGERRRGGYDGYNDDRAVSLWAGLVR